MLETVIAVLITLLVLGAILYVVDALPINQTVKLLIKVAGIVGAVIYWLVQLQKYIA